MGRFEKLLEHILMRRGDANIAFPTLCQLLTRLGFGEPIKGVQAKAYQVNQLRNVILRYALVLGD